VVTMESLESDSQFIVPPDFQNESSSTATSGNLQLEPSGSEDHSPEQFEQKDFGDEPKNDPFVNN